MDPIIALAFTIQSSPGLYALFLGSGLSRGAGVPTGWEVVLDLIRKIARLEGADPEPDPVAWYRGKFGSDPDYSRLLEQLSKSNAERTQLLRGYFEPTADEREQGIKVPGKAHRAIAELVAKGYIRVIVTTNFDRLIEQALDAAGVTPTVISTPDAVEGMLPLAHVRCLVLKLHGDYHDIRIRNTQAELDEYDPRQNNLIDRILDEYGLVVCGWSAEWDTALRRVFERCKNRRFSSFWTTRGSLGPAAQTLVALRQAQQIPIRSADEFFQSLANKVQALADTSAPHPVSVKAAVAEVKRYLPDERSHIRLHDLVAGETTRVIQELKGPALGYSTETAPEGFSRRLGLSDALTEVLRAMVAAGCYHGNQRHIGYWVLALERLVNSDITLGINSEFGLYPAVGVLYTAGISAIAANHLDTLGALLVRPKVRRNDIEMPLATVAYPENVLMLEQARLMHGYERRYTPISDYLFNAIRPGLLDLVPDNNHYADCFDSFEYLASLVYLDIRQRAGDGDWSPIGRFGWTLKRPGRPIFPERIAEEAQAQGNNWPLIKAGLFGGDINNFHSLRLSLNEKIRKLPWR